MFGRLQRAQLATSGGAGVGPLEIARGLAGAGATGVARATAGPWAAPVPKGPLRPYLTLARHCCASAAGAGGGGAGRRQVMLLSPPPAAATRGGRSIPGAVTSALGTIGWERPPHTPRAPRPPAAAPEGPAPAPGGSRGAGGLGRAAPFLPALPFVVGLGKTSSAEGGARGSPACEGLGAAGLGGGVGGGAGGGGGGDFGVSSLSGGGGEMFSLLALGWGVAKVAAVWVGVYAAVLAAAYVFQRKLQYFPHPGDDLPPVAALEQAYNGLEEWRARTADGVEVVGYYLPPPERAKLAWGNKWEGTGPTELGGVTLLMFHGNAGHRGHRLEWARMLQESLGVGVVLPDYRGYGGSEGAPSEEGLLMDAEAALAWTRGRAGKAGRVVLYGESIGCAVSVGLALRDATGGGGGGGGEARPVDGLILQSGFSSAAAVGAEAYPFLPVRALMKDKFDAAAWARALPSAPPALVLHGQCDDIVPLELAKGLYEALPGTRKAFVEVAEAGHNDVPFLRPREYCEIVRDFLRSI